jgi:hypothetical protein
MKAFKTLGQVLVLSALTLGTTTGSVEARGHSTLNGQISLKGQPVSGSSITLWQTQAGQFPKQLSTHRSNKSGAFRFKVRATPMPSVATPDVPSTHPQISFLNKLFSVANGSSLNSPWRAGSVEVWRCLSFTVNASQKQ